jgi:hypothetical protein
MKEGWKMEDGNYHMISSIELAGILLALTSFTIKLFHLWLFVYYTNFQKTVTGS